MLQPSRARIARYGMAVGLVVMAVGVRRLLDPVLGDRFPFSILFFAVLVSAAYGGLGPALVATLLGAVAAQFLLLPDRDSLTTFAYQNEAGLVLYLVVSGSIALLGGAMRAVRLRLHASAEEAVRQREELRATRKRAEDDARFLADASAALADLVDYEDTLQRLTRLAVPTFADWCTVDLLDEDGRLRRVAAGHNDPARVELAHEVFRRFPPDPAEPGGAWEVIRTGESQLVPEITPRMLDEGVKAPELRQLLGELGLRSYIGVPISVRRRVLGVLSFISTDPDRRYDHIDLGVAEDLAHRAGVAIENARLYQKVREADRRKDEYLALLGHELRNPLAPIRTALHILSIPGVDAAAARRAREMMERQVGHLVRLVDDLLDVSRIMRGKIEMRREPIELSAVMARAVEMSQPVIDAEGHTLTVAVPPGTVWLDGDAVRLSQVFANLVNNAARYTDRGGRVWLTASVEDGQAVVRVRDTGIGIAAAQLTRIFDMFYQAERRTTEARGGLGIGLPLARKIVELHGGQLSASSAGPGQGAEFTVRLPLRAAPEAATAADGGQAGRLPVRRVLVVDDSPDAANSLAMLLRLEGQEVRVAHDGPSALAQAEAQPPDVAFLDIGMPGMDGHELARRFRAHPALRSVTLVAVTGWGQEEDRRRSREAGFDQHLVKPVEPETLHRVLAGG